MQELLLRVRSGYHLTMNDGAAELVSVIIPVYNAERYLRQMLESVLGQTYSHIEVIAVDDGSTDGSLKILQEHSPPVQLICQHNKGSAAARNTGVTAARGQWVAFIDADDTWSVDKLERQMRAIDGFDWSHTDAIFRGGMNDGKRHSDFGGKIGGEVLESLACSNFISTSTVMVRRQVFLDAGGFDESLRSIQDWDLWTRIARRHPLAYVDEPLMFYRVHSASASRSTRRTLPEHLNVIGRIFSPGGPGEEIAHLRRKALANSYSICSHIATEEHDQTLALRYALMACLYEPLKTWRWRRLIATIAASTRVRH